jgi:hypothetical protein
MSGNRILADTNTLIYFFNDHPEALKALDGKCFVPFSHHGN